MRPAPQNNAAAGYRIVVKAIGAHYRWWVARPGWPEDESKPAGTGTAKSREGAFDRADAYRHALTAPEPHDNRPVVHGAIGRRGRLWWARLTYADKRAAAIGTSRAAAQSRALHAWDDRYQRIDRQHFRVDWTEARG